MGRIKSKIQKHKEIAKKKVSDFKDELDSKIKEHSKKRVDRVNELFLAKLKKIEEDHLNTSELGQLILNKIQNIKKKLKEERLDSHSQDKNLKKNNKQEFESVSEVNSNLESMDVSDDSEETTNKK